MVTYSDSGVDIDLEERTVSSLTAKLKETLKWQDVITESGHFAALVRLGDKAIAMSTDGVGSKILVAQMMGKYDTVGIDCIAMVVNDILCVGAVPVALVDYLAVEKPDPNVAIQIGEGLVTGANLSKIAIIGGETASLPEIINDLDLAATGMGLVDADKIITGEKIESGDVLIGIESSGIHSNGLSLARRVLFHEANLGVNDELPGFPDKKVGEELLNPTAIYVEPVVELFKSSVDIHGLAHITGGGFTNLKRLKKGVGYNITQLPEPQPVFQSIYSFNVPLEEMYRVFNMGIGFVIVVKEDHAAETLKIIQDYMPAHQIGQVINDVEGKVKINTFTGTTLEM
jgi:phosphoribosylformylglycinamidine cyclo-ligase